MKEGPIYGTGRASGAYQIFAPILLVDHEQSVLFAYLLDLVLVHRRAGTLEKIVIKLETSYGMLRSFFRKSKVLEVEVQSVEAHETVRVGTRVKFQILDYLGCNPASAEFATRK